MTRTFKTCNVKVSVTRTAEKATILSIDKSEIVSRNIWVGDNGKKYVQYRNRFYGVSKSDYYTQDYFMW